VTILDDNGVPTPVVHSKIPAPRSRMAPSDGVEAAAKASPLYAKYGTRTESQSAREMLAARIAAPPVTGASPKPTQEHKDAASATGGGAAAIGKFLASKQGQRVEREVVRGVFGLLKKSL
jgi:hypothetical protein